MNRRNRARFLSVLLAVLMITSVIPEFLNPVSAAGYITGVSAETNYGDSVLFNGFPYFINVTINASSSTFANVTLYYEYQDGHNVTVYSRVIPITAPPGSVNVLINSSDPTDVPPEYEKIPQDVQRVYLIVYEYDIANGNIPGTEREFNFDVKFPFTVMYRIQSSPSPSAPWQAYYWNGTAWADDKAFVGMPFDVYVTIQYNQTLIGSGVQLPDPNNLSVILVNQSYVTWYNYGTGVTEDNGKIILKFDNANLTTGEYNFSATVLITDTEERIRQGVLEKIVVNDTENGLVNAQNEFMIYPLVMEITDVATQPTQLYQNVPFNVILTGQVFANISGTLYNFTLVGTTAIEGKNPKITDGYSEYVMTFGYADGLVPNGGIGTAHWTDVVFNGTYFNATWADNILFISPNPKYGYDDYYPRYIVLPYAHNPIPINPWDIQITPSIACPFGSCTDFYVGINQTLNITVTYPLSPYYNLTSIANYSILLNGNEVYSGTISVINNTGSVVIPVNFNETGVVTIEVWDETYHPEPNNVTLEVKDWDLDYAYLVVHYPGTYNIYDDKFYVGIPAELDLDILYNEPCPVNSTVDVTLKLPNGTVLQYAVQVNNANETIFVVPETFLFSEPGFVVVTYNDTNLGKSVTFSIPVKDWGIFVDASPEELTENETVNLNVFVVESLYFGDYWDGGPGTRNVTVTLELPDGYANTRTLVLEQNDDWFNGQGGYQGIITFENITPQAPGIAWVTVTDVLGGKTVKMPIQIKAAITPDNKWIDVVVTPESEPVYAYIDNHLRIQIQYMYSDGIAAYKNYVDTKVNITITDADGHEYYINELPVASGYVEIPSYAIPVNGTSDIAISVVDAYNASITGGAVIPVTSWNVTFDFATDGTVWQYVDNTLYVTVHVNGPSVPVNVTINGAPYENVVDGQVIEYPITDPQGTLNFNVIATYDGHQVGYDTYTVDAQEWDVTFDFATDGTVWQYVDNTLYVTVHVNGPSVPVNVTINGAPVGSYSDGDVITVAIVDPQGTLTYNVEATYNGHVVGTDSYTIEPIVWNATITVEPEMLYWGISDELHVSAEPTSGVPLTASDLTVDVSTNYGNANGMGEVTIPLINPENNVTGTAEVYYNGHLINATVISIPIQHWDVIVKYTPQEFYYLPQGYVNPPLVGNVTLTLPWEVAHDANITFNADLPDLGIEVGSSASNYFDIDFSWAPEKFVFNESGTIFLIIKLFDPATNFVYYSETYPIPIKLALDATVSPSVAYVNVPFDLTVNVTSVAASPNITVMIEGTNYTASATQNGVITIPDVVLNQSGTYTVTIHDAALNATITRTFEVRDWHIEVTPTPDEIRAGSVYDVNFTIKLVDSEGLIANISENANLALEFSNTSVIPSGFYTWIVPIADGQGQILNAPIFAPVAGTFQIIVTDQYGKVNDTEQIIVNEPDPADLTYVYVNIRKEGSLEPPGEPVKLYWGLELGGVKKYFQVYNPTYSADYSEAMFTLYPQQPFDLYVIAVPETINYPILEEGKNYTWENVLQNINETWYELNKTVTVTPIDGGWIIDVAAAKYEVKFVNITKEIYSLEVTNVPGLIQITPGSASVQGNAIFSGITEDTYHYEDVTRELIGNTSNSTTITIEPNELTLELLDNTHLKPTQAGEYFTFKAMLSITNAEDQFDTQWIPFENWISNISFLNDTERQEIINEILTQVGDVSAVNGPVANATLDFHIDNTTIAYLDPVSAVTDENGSATFRVYTKATSGMTPEELINLMGTVDVWATYDGLASNHIAVEFGGTGSISGDITDDSGNQIPGATVIVKYWNGTAWVNATDFEGNVLMAISADDGHYAISNVPASVDGIKYMVVATKNNLTGYAYVTVYPFATSTADIKLRGLSEINGIAMYKEKVETADTVYFVFNNLGTPDAFSVSQYVARTVPITTRTVSKPVSEFDMSEVTANDVVVSVGGPLVNPVTAAYEDIAPVHMDTSNSPNITIITPEGNLTWTAPTPWWNVTEGYFIIQVFTDANTGALVVTIYGTDADSTAAGAYYFLTEVYPNITDYNGITYIVGEWQDTEAGADIPLPGADLGDTSGFSAGDTITIVFMG